MFGPYINLTVGIKASLELKQKMVKLLFLQQLTWDMIAKRDPPKYLKSPSKIL